MATKKITPNYIEEVSIDAIMTGGVMGGGLGLGGQIGVKDFSVSQVKPITENEFDNIIRGKELQVGQGAQIFKVDKNGLFMGASTFATAPFKVSMSGVLTATAVVITGMSKIFYQTTAPSSGMITNDYWLDSDNNKWYRYSGSAWVAVQDADIITALNNASTAQSAAEAAQGDATTALNTLSDIADDEKITPNDKLQAKQLWDIIVTEGTATTGTIPVQATLFGVADTDFDTAYAALNTYLNTTITVFANMATTTTIVRATWDTAWKNYYDEKTQLLNAISTKAKDLADTAQGAAEDAQTDANTANTAIANIASDDILSQVEKPSIIQDNTVILAEQTGIDAQATAYGITTEKTAYDNAITALTSYLATLTTPVLWSNLTGDTTIVGTAFRTKFSDVYTTRQALLDAIVAGAKSLADTAQGTADDAQGDATTALNSLSDIADDEKITPNDKLQAKLLWDAIVVEGTATTGKIPAQAISYGVATTAFDAAYSALNTYLNTTLTVFADMNATTTIVRATWDTKWKDYYNAKVDILNAIADATALLAVWDNISGAGKPEDNATVGGEFGTNITGGGWGNTQVGNNGYVTLYRHDKFCDGSDGNATISSNTTLTSDTYFESLTINNGCILNCGGYRVFVASNLENNGTIMRNGNNGGNGTTATAIAGAAGGSGGAALADGFLVGGEDGKAGGAGGDGSTYNNNSNDPGSDGVNGDNVSSLSMGVNGKAGVSGGKGGDSGSYSGSIGGAGGNAGTATPPVNKIRSFPELVVFRDYTSTYPTKLNGSAGSGGSGGGGGGESWTRTAGGGGGGGAGSGSSGGIILICASTIVNNGTISCLGGNGGNGGNGANGYGELGGGGGGGGGAGSGGSGGIMLLIYQTLTNNGTISVAGGSAGSVGIGGAGVGGATDGVNGSAGNNGTTGILIQAQC